MPSNATIRTRGAPVEFHQSLPGYRPTPLVACPDLAAQLGLDALWVKHEADRFGLPSFKPLGASWAASGLLGRRRTTGPPTLVAATAGNHGRAVAWFARHLGVAARVYVSERLDWRVIAEIRAEGAQVVLVTGGYDDAVDAAFGDADGVLVSDVARTSDDLGPQLVIDGYATLYHELDEQLADFDASPDVIAVPAGVGGLAAAAVRRLARRAEVIAVEPERAACVAASLAAGRPVAVGVPDTALLAGLTCGTPSLAAWDDLTRLDGTVLVTDDEAVEAARLLDQAGVTTTATGAAAVAGLRRWGTRGRAVAIVSEGARDR